MERRYLHPLMALTLGGATAAFVGIDFGSVLAALAVGVGLTALLLSAPMTKRVIGARRTCHRCGHRWTPTAEASRPSLRVVR